MTWHSQLWQEDARNVTAHAGQKRSIMITAVRYQYLRQQCLNKLVPISYMSMHGDMVPLRI